MITKQQYVEYLLSTPVNYTCTNLAEHLDGVSHDVVSDYLQRERLSARHLWELVQELISDNPKAYLIIDDSVHNKQYSRPIEMVKRQYSGAVGGLVRGIGVVNLVHSSGADGEYYPIDFRVYANAQEANDVRWQVEAFHRELKQLTGSEKYQCRKARSQRSHLACCYHAWVSLKVYANSLGKTLYQVRRDLFSDYLRAETPSSHYSGFSARLSESPKNNQNRLSNHPAMCSRRAMRLSVRPTRERPWGSPGKRTNSVSTPLYFSAA